MTRWRNVFCEIACGAARQRRPAAQYRTIMPDLFNVNYISRPYCLTQKSYFLRQAAHPIDMFK